MPLGVDLFGQERFGDLLDEAQAEAGDSRRLRSELARLRGLALLGLERLDEARVAIDEAPALDGANATAFVVKFALARSEGNPEQARAHLLHATEFDRHLREAWLAIPVSRTRRSAHSAWPL